MRFYKSKERDGWLFRVFGYGHNNDGGEIAYASFRINGLCAEIEFPSDWHEQRRAWARLGLIFVSIGISFPWPWTVPDEYQCSGPRYGFTFFDDGLHLSWGKSKGKRDDPFTIIRMPWGWRHKEHKVLSNPETHPYKYVLKSGEVQERIATIQIESRLWTRPWIPYRLLSKYIEVHFSDEVGERSGSWKGGTIGCSYDMKPGETALQTLKRMEAERVFN